MEYELCHLVYIKQHSNSVHSGCTIPPFRSVTVAPQLTSIAQPQSGVAAARAAKRSLATAPHAASQ